MYTSLNMLLISAIFKALFAFADANSCCGFNLDGSRQETAGNPLLNGRIWKNNYPRSEGNQFFITDQFSKGSVSSDARSYDNLNILYDITNDELLLWADGYPVIILNKELVDSFTLRIGDKKYSFFNAGNDPDSLMRGYIRIVYRGTSALYIKHYKRILPLAVDGRYDLFTEGSECYLKTAQGIKQIAGKREIISLLAGRKKEMKQYMRKAPAGMKGNNPESYAGMLMYYDGLTGKMP